MKYNYIIEIQNNLQYADENLLNFIYQLLQNSVPDTINRSLTSNQQKL